MCTVFAQANVESYLCTTMCNKCKTGLKLKWISVTYYCHTLLYGWAVNISHKIFVSVNHRWSLSPCSALWPVGLVLSVFLKQLRHSSHRWECCHLFVLCCRQKNDRPLWIYYWWMSKPHVLCGSSYVNALFVLRKWWWISDITDIWTSVTFDVQSNLTFYSPYRQKYGLC